MKHNREPIKHTCPEINNYIKWINYAIVKDRELRNMDEKELFDCASSMSSQLEECIGYLESLRKSNETLRDWGNAEAEMVDELEQRIIDSNNLSKY